MKDKPVGKVIGLKIETSRKEDSPKNLAIQLANFLQREMNARTDAREFKGQATRERQKAREFSNVLIMLGEYRRKKKKAIDDGKEWEPSRMEPMESYDDQMIKKERVMLIERAASLDRLAQQYELMADEAKRNAAETQEKLINLSKE